MIRTKGNPTVSIDPSAIPNFGGSSQPNPQQGGPGGAVVPDQKLVQELLDQMELKHTIDDDGDLVAPWEGFRVYFMFRSDEDSKNQLFAVRAFYDRAYDVDSKPSLLEVVDEWNRRTLWPKVYTMTHQEGDASVVRLVGEAQTVIGHGVALEHFVSSTVGWVQAAIEFERWIVEQLGIDTAKEKEAREAAAAAAQAEAAGESPDGEVTGTVDGETGDKA
ncbi:YbjN domain-containing protein [Streptomyces thermolineatus]|uniref:YbjN domain-containing protein n=1 Tax=Streptomyces thermolineatus TaxID=44033 RepID=A0ABN3M325_9ACTN